MVKKLLSGAFIYSVLPQLPKLITIFTYPLLTAHLSVNDYGVYGLITAYVGMASILKDLGFTLVFINVYYKHKDKYKLVWRHLHGVLHVWTLVYAIITSVILLLSIPEEAGKNIWQILFFSIVPVLFFENAQTLSSIYYRIKEKPLPVSLIVTIGGIVTIVVSVVTIVYFNMGYMGWLYASFAASATMFIFHAYHLYVKNKLFPILRIRWSFMRKYFKVGGPMLLHDYSGYLLNTSDRVVMDILKIRVGDIGFYNMAYIFGSYFAVFETAMGMAASPIFLRYYSEKKIKEARLLTFVSQCIFLIISFLTCLWLREIFFFLVRNDELKMAYSLAIVIIMGYNYKPMYQAATNILFYTQKTAAILKVSFTAGILNVVLNFLFIPIWGISAAAFTTFSCLLFMGFSGFYIKEYKKSETINYYPLQWLAGIIGITIFVYLIRDIAVIYKLIITIFLLGTIAIMFRKYKNILLQN